MKTVKRTTTKQAKKAGLTGVRPIREIAELRVERLPLSKLKPHPKNPRKHPAKGSTEWENLKTSLEHDYFDPMVWNRKNGMLVSGHLRRRILLDMGTKMADVVVVDYEEPLHLARMLSANKAIGSNDLPALLNIFEELVALPAFDLGLTGFANDELAELSPDLGRSLGFNVAAQSDMPQIKESESGKGFLVMSFTVHESQVTAIKEAMTKAKKAKLGVSDVNKNSNGNALAGICRSYNSHK
jgi:hypothetical protein